MPIRVNETPEPLTSATESTPTNLAECEAYRVLLHDILRYGRRQTMGRSVLIAGHRGSGKTTLVRWAIQNAQSTLAKEPNAARPLLVPLHGPDLLGGESVLEVMASEAQQKPKRKTETKQPPGEAKKEVASSNATTSNSGKQDDTGKNGSDYRDTQAALRMLTEALHRAYVNELSRALGTNIRTPDEERQLRLNVVRDHLRIQLDQLSNAATTKTVTLDPSFTVPGYRSLKRKIDRLREQVSSADGENPNELVPLLLRVAEQAKAVVDRWPKQHKTAIDIPSQELPPILVILEELMNEPRSIAELQELAAQLQVALDHAPDLDEMRFVWEAAGKLQNGVLFHPPRRNDQGFRELVAASLVIEAYKRVAGKLENVDGRSRQSEFSEKTEAKAEWSGKDFLNPLVGLLTGGVAGAGILAGGTAGLRPILAAVVGGVTAVASAATLNYASTRSRKTARESTQTFTWDTSVATLDRMLPAMVERITDAGLAPIFVVDELDKIPEIEKKMENLIRHLKHLVTEKTFFCFLADRSYFEHVIANSRTKAYGKEHTFFSERLFIHYLPGDMHKYLDSTLLGQHADSNEEIDLKILPLLLLHRAKMHPIDLRRAISDMTNESAIFDLAPGAIREAGFKIAIFIQAAIEFLLDEEDIRNRLRQDPTFARLAYDALYIPSRSWEAGSKDVKLSPAAVQEELGKRMKPEDGETNYSGNVSDPDLAVLCESVRKLADFLRAPKDFVFKLKLRRDDERTIFAKYKEEPWNTLSQLQLEDVPPLLDPEDGEATSRWLIDPFGRRPAHARAVAADNQQPTTQPAPPAITAPPEPTMSAETSTPQSTSPSDVTSATPETMKPLEVLTPSVLTKQIRSLDQFVREMTGERLNLDKLASEIRLIGLSPAWPSADAVMKKIETGGAEVNDATVLQAYWRTLNSSNDAIRYAFILSELISRVMPGKDRPRKIDRALRLLSTDLRLHKIDVTDTVRILKSLVSGQLRKDNNDLLETRGFPHWIRRFNAWRDAGGFAIAIPLIDEHYQRWLEFFVTRFRSGQSIFTPNFDDLLHRAIGNALPFKPDLAEMTYGDYAEVLLTLESVSPNHLLHQVVLVELGFSQQVDDRLSTMSPLPANAFDLLEVLKTNTRLRRTGERVLLIMGGSVRQEVRSEDGETLPIVPKGVGSAAAAWPVSTQHTTIPVFLSDMAIVIRGDFAPDNLTMILSEVPQTPVPPKYPINLLFFLGGAQSDVLSAPTLDDAIALLRAKSAP